MASFSLVCFTAFAQTSGKIEVEHERSLTGAVTRIIYKDTETQEIIKEISVEDSDLNPYKDLDYPRTVDPRYKYAYDLSNEDKYDLFDKYLSNTNYPRNKIDKLNFSKAIVFSSVFKHKNFRFVSYHLVFKNGNDCPVGKNVSLVILDSIGEVFKKINNSIFGFGGPQLTNDFRFLSYLTSGDSDIGCYSSIPPSTAVIYDFELEEPILIETITGEYSIGQPFLKEEFNYFVIKFYLHYQDGYQYNIIFPHNRILYSKYYTESEREMFITYRADGIVLKDSIRGERLDSFEMAFQKTTF